MAGTIGARISDEKLNFLKDYCSQKGITISDLILQALNQVMDGKLNIKEKAPRILAMCPECGMHLFYNATKKEGPHVFCIRCGWWSPVELPEEWHQGTFEIK